jgi:hypothetical protein
MRGDEPERRPGKRALFGQEAFIHARNRRADHRKLGDRALPRHDAQGMPARRFGAAASFAVV